MNPSQSTSTAEVPKPTRVGAPEGSTSRAPSGTLSQIGENFGGEIKTVSAEARSSQKAPLGGAGEMQDRVRESISPPHSPESYRAQAAECGRLANIAAAQRDHAEVGRLITRARELCLLAIEAEAEAPK